jgi:hypothetical protein
MRKIYDLSVTLVPEVLLLDFLRPRAHVADIAVPNMDTATVPCALDVGRGAVVAPVTRLIAPATNPPCGAPFVIVISADFTALTAVVSGQLHHLRLLLLFGLGAHSDFVKTWSLQGSLISGTAHIAPSTNLSAELPGT